MPIFIYCFYEKSNTILISCCYNPRMKIEEKHTFILQLIQNKQFEYHEYDKNINQLKAKSNSLYNTHMFFKELIELTSLLASNNISFQVEADNSIQIL